MRTCRPAGPSSVSGCTEIRRARAALLQMSCDQHRGSVAHDGLGSFCSVDPLQFSSTGLRETLVLHCKGVWVQGNGEEEGTLGQAVLSAGVSPRPGPRQQTMPTFCACPIDSGCRGTLPWISSMGTLRARGISLMARQELL